MSITSSNSAQLIYGSKVYEVLQYYFAPLTNSQSVSTLNNELFSYIGQVTPWEDELNPPMPTQDQRTIKSYYNNIIASKRLGSNDISPVVPRIDWTSGTVYHSYTDIEDMFTTDANGVLTKPFYVRNRFDQVFKCLWNNNGEQSSQEPQFLPGTYKEDFIVYGTDGYKWKYLYTIDAGLKQRFIDPFWMPVPTGKAIPNPVATTAGLGSIDVINVTNGGLGYYPGGVSVTIVGDGTGANAGTVTVNSSGSITDVSVTNAGGGYGTANAIINILPGYPSISIPAVAIAPASPTGGHGYDPISELGCSHVMVTSEYNKDENGIVPTDFTYRQVGLILNPLSQKSILSGTGSSNSGVANGAIYDVTTHLFVSTGQNDYVSGQKIYQGPNITNATFIATVASFDGGNNIVKVINTVGVPSYNQPLIQDSNGPVVSATRTLLKDVPPDFITNSGYMLYVENRTGVQRSPDGIEQFRIVLRF